MRNNRAQELCSLVLLAAFPFAGCKPETPKEQPQQDPQAAAPAREQWKTYEDKYIKLQYPPGFVVAAAVDNPKNRTWMAGTPDEGNPGVPVVTGSLGIAGFYDGKETRPLGDIFAKEFWGDYKPTSKMRQFSPKNGECLMLLTAGGSLGSCRDSHGKRRDAPSCAESHFDMRCYDGSKHFFRIGSVLGRFEKGSRPKSVEENLQTVERMVASLEFK